MVIKNNLPFISYLIILVIIKIISLVYLLNYKDIDPITEYKFKRNISFNIKNKNNVSETRLIVWDPYIIHYNINELYNNYSTNY